MHVFIEGETHIGKVRDENQDAIAWHIAPNGLFGYLVIADGMGGYTGGALASRLAVETVTAELADLPGSALASMIGDAIDDFLIQRIDHAISRANDAIGQRKRESAEHFRHMGTTLVIALVWQRTLYVGHVGDSRAYLFRGQELSQLTSDHTVAQDLVASSQISAEEIAKLKLQDALTRAVGIDVTVNADVGSLALQPGDTILCCTDGLTKHLTDYDIAHELSLDLPLNQSCWRLIDAVLEAGARDNVSAGIIHVT
jgi:protein phosphatase